MSNLAADTDTERPEAGTGAEPGDAELVARVLDGQREAYATLVRRHQEILYRHARGMRLDHDTAEDLVQDALVTAYTRLRDCRDPDRFGIWAFRILRNLCLDHVKNIRRRSVPLEDVSLQADAGDPEEETARSELREDLSQALDGLTPDLRDAFLMKHHEGRSYKDMADLAGASVSAMKMRVHRARDLLKEALTGPSRTGATM